MEQLKSTRLIQILPNQYLGLKGKYSVIKDRRSDNGMHLSVITGLSPVSVQHRRRGGYLYAASIKKKPYVFMTYTCASRSRSLKLKVNYVFFISYTLSR